MTEESIAGVDACKGGWLTIVASSWPPAHCPYAFICRDFAAVRRVTEGCIIVAIDIPIGLPRDGRRRCDEEAKRLLRGAASTVFFAPPRDTLSAKTAQDFQTLHRKINGMGAQLPVWGIMEKIEEVDRQMTPELQKRIREFHPEVAWYGLTERVLQSKHQPVGRTERRRLLTDCIADRYLEIFESWKMRVGRSFGLDDLYDALVGLRVAHNIRRDLAKRLPDSVEADQSGLSMEIWF